MSCRRAFETDLLAVLHGEDADPEFAAHYPACAECSAEVQVWRELDTMLRAGAPVAGSHPAPQALLAFVDAPATLAATVRGEVERHLGSCRACADEVRTLRTFDATRLVAAGVASGASTAVRAARAASTAVEIERRPATVVAPRAGAHPTRERPGASEGSWLARLVWHPAFAYALVVLLLVPVLRDQLPRVAEETRVVDARRQAPLPAAPGERDAGQPAAMMKRSAPDALADAPRPAPNAAAPPEAPRPLAQAPAAASPPARPAVALRGEDEGAPGGNDVTGMLRPASKARSADTASRGLAAPPAGSEALPGGAAAGHRDELARREAAPALEERARHDAAPAAAADQPLVIALAAHAPTTIAAGAGEAGAVVRVVAPADLAPGPLDVSVRARAGLRELHSRVTDRAGAIEVQIPPHWLVPGDYAVTLTPVDAGPNRAHEPAIFGFTVRTPTAR